MNNPIDIQLSQEIENPWLGLDILVAVTMIIIALILFFIGYSYPIRFDNSNGKKTSVKVINGFIIVSFSLFGY